MRLLNYKSGKNYDVEGPVYENELSKIWCGRTSNLEGRPLFVKMLNYGQIADRNIAKDLLEVAKQEAITLKKAAECSRYVPKLYDAWDDVKQRRYVIVMDMLPGQSLRMWMDGRKKTLQAKEIFVRKCLILQICEIMRDINKKYPLIVHRDLKPENILLDYNTNTKRWDVYVLDFGCANLNHVRKVGTTNYQAPEQLGIKDTRTSVTNKTDIFAIGQIFYEMLLGTPPIIDVDYLRKARNENWVQTPHLPDELTQITGVDKLEAVLIQMTAFDPIKRPTYEKIITYLKNIRVE